MSRDLCYRVWDNEQKEYSDKPFSLDRYGVLYIQDEEGYWKEADEGRFVIEFATGLQDKDGKEIYEGDVVSCYSLSGEYGALFVVKYGKLPDICGHDYCPCLQGFYLDEIDEYEEVDEEGDMEVIGNIHEPNMERVE